MKIFSFDVESTGLDFVKDRVIEVGAVLYSTGHKKCLESQGFLVKSDVAISKEITDITGITQQAVDAFGWDSSDALEQVMFYLDSCDAVIGHNVIRFDKKMLEAWGARQGISIPEKLWVDTYNDLPNAKQGTLTHMAADVGFLNLFPHSALADCQTVLTLLSHFDFDEVLIRAKSPMVVVQAHQARHQNDAAKKLKFRWYPEKKQWWRWAKEMDVEELAKAASFDISIHRENIEEFQNL